MANKLTDDKLTELIKQTLNEFKVGDFNIDYDDWKGDKKEIGKFVDSKTTGKDPKEADAIEKLLFNKLSNLKPPDEKITQDDLEIALAVDDNGSFVQDYETVVRPSLYILADRWNVNNDEEAKKAILKLYYSLRPQSQISPINKTIRQLLKASGGEEAAKIGDQAMEDERINLKTYTPPKFDSSSLSSDGIESILQKNKQLGAVDKLPRIKIDESWGVSGASSIPLLYQEAVKSIGGNTVREKIENIANFFNELLNGNVKLTSGTDKEKITELFNKIIVLQSIRYLASPVSMQGTTGQTGGWLFESLVASLAIGKKAGGNFQIEDVVFTGTSGAVTGYTLKFKKEGSDLGSALSNFLRFFFTDDELKPEDDREKKAAMAALATKTGRSISDASVFGSAAELASGTKSATDLYGAPPEKLVLIYGARSDDYREIQFKQMEIDLQKGREMLVSIYTKAGIEDFGSKTGVQLTKKQMRADNKKQKRARASKFLKKLLDDGVKNAATLGPKIDFSNMDTVEEEAIKLMKQLNVDIEKITSSFESFKILAYTYLQNFKPEIAAASKEKFTDLRTEVNTVYETFGSGVQLENKNKSLKDLDKLIERVILEHINK